jgi:hypothetical protein
MQRKTLQLFAMKLKPNQIKKLSHAVYNELRQKNLIQILSTESKIQEKIEAVIFADVKLEEDIEKESKKIMDKFRDKVESGEIDYQEMYRRVKQQLIKDKKFIV